MSGRCASPPDSSSRSRSRFGPALQPRRVFTDGGGGMQRAPCGRPSREDDFPSVRPAQVEVRAEDTGEAPAGKLVVVLTDGPRSSPRTVSPRCRCAEASSSQGWASFPGERSSTWARLSSSASSASPRGSADPEALRSRHQQHFRLFICRRRAHKNYAGASPRFAEASTDEPALPRCNAASSVEKPCFQSAALQHDQWPCLPLLLLCWGSSNPPSPARARRGAAQSWGKLPGDPTP